MVLKIWHNPLTPIQIQKRNINDLLGYLKNFATSVKKCLKLCYKGWYLYINVFLIELNNFCTMEHNNKRSYWISRRVLVIMEQLLASAKVLNDLGTSSSKEIVVKHAYVQKKHLKIYYNSPLNIIWHSAWFSSNACARGVQL